jgi:glycosyltransferase involved in cell wall biosynthesis
MKILYLVTEDWYFYSHRFSLAVEAKSAGHDVMVLTRIGNCGELISSAGIKLIHIEFERHGLNPLKELKCLYKIWKIYRKVSPDIVHQIALKPIIYGSIIALTIRRPIKIINSVAGMGFLYVSKSLKAKFLKLFTDYAFRVIFNKPQNHLIVQNQDDFNYFVNKFSVKNSNISIVRGVGVNIDIYRPAPKKRNKLMVMVASRLLWSKGIKEFVDAARILRGEGYETRFVVVGEIDSDNPENIPIKQIDVWKNDGIVEFWGHQINMQTIIRKADIICLPSYREGMPKVLIEGAACAKPLIATDVPGCREIIHNQKNGFLVPAQNSIALASAISTLLNSSELREQMGKCGRALVENFFDEKINIKETLDIYNKVFTKKLIYFISEDWYFYSHRLSLAIAAKNQGYDVCLVTRFTNHRDLINDLGIRTIPLNLSRIGMNPLMEIIIFFKILKIYNRERPDIVHHVAIKPVLYGSLAALIVGQIYVVNAMAGMGYVFNSKKIRTKLIRFFIKKIFKFVFNRLDNVLILQNPDDVNFFKKNNLTKNNKIKLIRGSGVDVLKYFPVKKDNTKPVILLASRLIWDKGIGDFVKAATLLKGNVDARFVIVGKVDKDNPEAIPLEVMEEWNRLGVIEWWGYKSDMNKVFSQSHIACLPSYYGEGVPKFLIEAASSGLPIITTDWPGCKEIVENGKNGLLIPVKNPEMLALKIKELVENSSIWTRMGILGREKVQNEFSLERVIAQTINLYK